MGYPRTKSVEPKIQAKITVASQVSTGLIAIVLAYMGFGVWALAIQSVLSVIFRMVLLWYYSKWVPKLQFSRQSMKYLWGFGSKMLATGIISNFFQEINSVIIGKAFTKADLGNYSRANQIARLIPDFFQHIIQKVTIPTLAQFQYDSVKLTTVYRKYINLICLVCVPCMFLIAALSKPIVLILLTEKWSSCIVMLQILAIGQCLIPVGSINLSLLQVLNRTDLTVKLEIIKKTILALIVFSCVYFGLIYLIIGTALYNYIGVAINMYVSKKFLKYTYKEQLKDIGIYMIIAFVISCVVYVLIQYITNMYLQLVVGGGIGVLAYILTLRIFKNQAFIYIVSTIKSMYIKRVG